MTALDDLNLEVGPLDTPEAFLEAWADPERRWYARRRRHALAAAGLLGAAWSSVFEALHPRGRDGKFIEKWSVVRWFDAAFGGWRQGVVRDIDPDTGAIHVERGDGNHFTFNDPKKLITRPTPKARMNLPVGGSQGEGTAFDKYKGQGGSNPGGFYEVMDAKAAMPGNPTTIQSPDISREHTIQRPLRLAAQGGLVYTIGQNPDMPLSAYQTMGEDTVVVPSLDGVPNRYDVLTRIDSQWYQVPSSGSITTTDGTPRTDLVVPVEAIFGEAGSSRRATIIADPQAVISLLRKPDVSPDDLAALVQKSASPPPVNGDKFYVKTMNIPERARNEALANAFYEQLGIAVPEVGVGQDGKTVSSKLIGEKVDFDPNNPAHVKAAQDGFVADAWLANWDAVGLSYDNMQVNPDGTVFRVDAGGALLYRAQGKPKGQMFGNDVGELDSLRNPSINPQATKVYGGITETQLQEQGELLRSISPGRITELAEMYDMPEIGPVLIARRKSILDQLGIGPMPQPDVPEPPKATSVYNPVEQVVQPGTPPEVAVDNYEVALGDLPTVLVTGQDLLDPDLMMDAVFVYQGGLWVGDGPYKGYSTYGTMNARDLVTGRKATLSLYPKESEFLSTHTKDDTVALEDMADQLKAMRDLAVAEIATDSMGFDSIADAMNNWNWKESFPQHLQPQDAGVYHLDHLNTAIKNGTLPENGPLYNTTTGLVSEIVSIDDETVELRDSGMTSTYHLTQLGLMNTGPWREPRNDTAVAMYNARLHPGVEEPDSTLEQKAQIAETVIPEGVPGFADSDPFPDPATAPADVEDALNAKFAAVVKAGWSPEQSQALSEYTTAMNAFQAGEPIPATPALDKASGTPPITQPDVDIPTPVVENEQFTAIEEQAVDAAQPEVSVTVDEDSPILKALGPQEPLYTGNMSTEETDWQHLVGQSVVVLTEAHFENPDTQGKMTEQNGLMKIESMQKQVYSNILWIRGIKGDGTKVSVPVGLNASQKKYIIPVATEPVTAMPLTFKTDGTIWSGKRNVGKWYKPYETMILPNGESVGTYGGTMYYTYRAVINGDESITGKPVVVYGHKKGKMKSAVYGYTRPVAPPPTKPKKEAVQKTEAEIAKLKQDYAEKLTPQVHAEVTEAYTGKYVTAPVGQAPLADGSLPVVGQWVYSPKDNTFWQVVQTDPKLTGKVPGTNLRVRRQKSVGGPWVESFRGRSTMYAVESPGALPKVYLDTAIVTTGDGKQVGPGMFIETKGGGSYRVLETKGGKMKIATLDYSKTHWVDPANVLHPTWQTATPTVVQQISEADLQSMIDAEVAKTVSDKVAELVAHDLATPTPKKKKAPVTYPGPEGKLVKQNPVYAENRLKKGLAVLADGNAPMVGQVLRHKDGTQYIVVAIGTEWKSSQKNSVSVIKVGESYYNDKWRAMSTLVVDHEAMLTDSDGKALPAVAGFAHPKSDFDIPDRSFIWRRDQQKFTGYDDNGKPRYKTVSSYYAVAEDGKIYDLATGSTVWQSNAVFAEGTRIAYVDKEAGDQQITITVDDPMLSYPVIVGLAVHSPTENPTALLAGKTKVPPSKPAPTSVPIPPVANPPTKGELKIGDHVTYFGEPKTVIEISPADDSVLLQSEDSNFEEWASITAIEMPVAQSATAKDGTKIVVGMQVNAYGDTMTVTAVDSENNQIKLQLPDGDNYGWVPADSSYVTGISPDKPEPDIVTPATITLTDGTVLNVGDTVQINDQPDMTITAITSNMITAHYPPPNTDLVGYFDVTSNKINSGQGTVTPTPEPTVTPAEPPEPPPVIQPESTGVDLAGDLPPFEGIIGAELAHPPIKSSAAGSKPVFSPTNQGAPLHEKAQTVKSDKVRSVMDAVADTVKITQDNKSGDRNWASVYALADKDAIDDMLVQTQVVRDAKGQDFVEVRFRLNNAAAAEARSQLLVKGGGSEYGDWVKTPINPKSLVLGDSISVKVSSQNATQLKPNDIGFPNAVVAGGPTLVGKSENGQFDVYRVEVAFSNGASGVLELQDRLGPSINTYAWDESKVRQTNGALSLNPTAKSDGWAVRYTSLHYNRAGGGQSMEWEKDGAKKLGQTAGEQVGSGHVLEWSGNGTTLTYSSAGHNSMDGMTVIRVPADDPDAQAKISSAMERVGITPEQQKPPDAEALTYMALNKVYKQFSPTYIKGQTTDATPAHPESALALIDNAVGKYMPGQRKVTMDDLSISVTPDGWAQVLVSEDVAKAIVARNGVTHYYHRFTASSTEITLEMGMNDGSPGLMASTERFSNGMFFFGMSSQSDHSHDSANRLFLRASKSGSHSSHGGAIMVLNPVTMHRLVDYYWQPNDSFGDRNSNNLNFLNMGSPGSGNEMMIKRRVDARLWGRVLLASQTRDNLIAKLHKQGITHAPNGQLLEDFFIVGSVDADKIPEGDFGGETPIPELAATVSVPV